ncbi:MAG: deazaflavin-dependent nitroreductase Ddn [Chloroflexota bacterium]
MRTPRAVGSPATKIMMKAGGTVHRTLYRLTNGRFGHHLGHMPVLLLTTTGRKTGQPRTWPVAYLPAGDALVVIASAGGEPRHPAWYLNLRANPRVSVQLGTKSGSMLARVTEGQERAELWARVVQSYPVFAGYEGKTSRQIPVVVLEPALGDSRA